MLKDKYKYIILFLVISLLLLTIFILTSKILKFTDKKVKGIHTSSNIRDAIIFDIRNNELKYFYELKSNEILRDNPGWLGYTAINTINNDSFNDRYDYPLEKDNNTYRIITLGDSFTYGLYVNTEENYPEVLEDMLNKNLKCKNIKKFEVINLGVGGYDIEYSVYRFIKRGIKYNPDMVIWLLHDGMFDRMNEYKIPIEKKLKEEGVPNFNSTTGVYEASNKAKSIVKNDFSDDEIALYQNKSFEILDEAIKKINNGKSKILIADLTIQNNSFRKVIDNFLTKSKNYIFLPVFNFRKDPSYHLLDGHANIAGNIKISENIFSLLKKNIFTECIIIN
jgi:hypothetical protein